MFSKSFTGVASAEPSDKMEYNTYGNSLRSISVDAPSVGTQDPCYALTHKKDCRAGFVGTRKVLQFLIADTWKCDREAY